MSRPNRPPEPTTRTEGSRRRDLSFAVIAVAMAGAVSAAVLLGSDPSANVDVGAAPSVTASGTVVAAGLMVEGARIDLGTVPLDVTVTPTWTISNTSSDVVILGEPHASVIDGCCPGPLSLSDVTLDPGESSTLAFPLQMHAGMDGPHDFDVHVPFGDSADYLTLKVVGDFAG